MKAAVVAVAATLVMTAPVAAPAPKVTPIFTVDGPKVISAEATRDGQRIYYQVDSTGVRVYDRRTRQHQTVYTGVTSAVTVSADSKTLLFEAPGEDGGKSYIWTMPLNPATGASAGTRRRVSMTWGEDPAFSTDGRLIAFIAKAKTADEQLLVVPASGGPERVLLSTGGAYSVWPVRWTPDDKWLVYGYSENSRKADAKNAIFRIPAGGGTPQMVMPTADWGAYPGLSPDGKVILAWAPDWDTTLVTTATGQRIAAYVADWGVSPDAWIDGTHALSVDNVQRSILQTRTLAGGSMHTISDTNSMYFEPTWSPDGRRLAAPLGHQSGLMVFDERGKGTLIKTKQNVAAVNSIHWSPDGSMLAFRSLAIQGTLNVVNLATGNERQLAAHSTQSVAVRWTASSRTLIYGVLDSAMAPDSSRRLEMHEVTTSGVDHVLRTMSAWCVTGGLGCLKYLNDSTALVHGSDLQLVVADLHGRTPDRVLGRYTSARAQRNPSVSTNGRWVAMRQQDASGQNRIIDVLATDAGTHRSVTLPAPTAGGADNPWISDDGQELIVACQASTADPITYYRLNVATGASTKLFDAPRGASGTGFGGLSPDRTSMVFNTRLPNRATIYELDYSEILKGRAGPQQ